MQENIFIWSDLSTFNPPRARKDYAALFGWSFYGKRSYKFALVGDVPVAAIFSMPKQFVELGMPSFWMSYVKVDNLKASVEKARSHDGVVVEIEPRLFNDNASIALIRDPSGAGFTLYEGAEFPRSCVRQTAGELVTRYHHLPDISLIEPFYHDMFSWSFHKIGDKPWPAYDIRHSDRSSVGFAEEVPEEIRGKYRYWIPCFTVASRTKFLTALRRRGGEAFSDLPGERTLVADRQGAHFMIRPQRPKACIKHDFSN